MPVRVKIPIRVRLRPEDVREPDAVYAAARLAIARALTRARDEALAPRSGYCRPLPMPPRFNWHGACAGLVAEAERRAWERGLGELLVAAWREVTPDAGSPRAVPLTAPPIAPAMPERLQDGAYLLDTYQQPPRQVSTPIQQAEKELLLQRVEIDALSEELRAILFRADERRALRPADYGQLLRIARILAGLTPAERAAYLPRTLGSTTGLADLEASVQAYVARVQQQRAAATAREVAESAFFQLDALYDDYRLWAILAQGSAQLDFVRMLADPSGPPTMSMYTQGELRFRLHASMQANGFDSVKAFEEAIRAFECAFRDDAVLLAQDLLDRYEKTLLEEERRYERDEVVRGLSVALEPARAHYAVASQIIEEENFFYAYQQGISHSQEEHDAHASAAGRARSEQAAGAAALARLSTDHPLVTRPDFPTGQLATSENDVGMVRGIMLGFIRTRLKYVRATRRNFAQNPDLVWRIPDLVAAAKKAQCISSGSVPDKIISNHINDREIEEAVIALAIGVIAVALSIVTGGGAIPVLAGISGAQALHEIHRYDINEAAYGAGLASDAPSGAWVLLAIAGAGMETKAALRAVGSAVTAFNRSAGAVSDLAELEREVERLRQIGNITDRLRDRIIRGARVELEAKHAWKAVRTSFRELGSTLGSGGTQVAHIAVSLAYPMWLSLRRGLIGIEQFLRMNEIVALIGDAARLSPAGATLMRKAYALSRQQVRRIAIRGAELGMLDGEIEYLLSLWNRAPNLTADELVLRMEKWTEPLRADSHARLHRPADFIEREIEAAMGVERGSITGGRAAKPSQGGAPRVRSESTGRESSPLDRPREYVSGEEYEEAQLAPDRPGRTTSPPNFFYEGGQRGSFFDAVNKFKKHLKKMGLEGTVEINEDVLKESAASFFNRHGNLDNKWRGLLEDVGVDIEEAYAKRQLARHNSLVELKDRIQDLKGTGKMGRKRPDLLEIFSGQYSVNVADITKKFGDRLHLLKTQMYVELAAELFPRMHAQGIEFRNIFLLQLLKPGM